MKERELREYLTETGRNPFHDWLHELRDTLVILLCGGDKQTQPRDIVKAKEYWITYRKRNSR